MKLLYFPKFNLGLKWNHEILVKTEENLKLSILKTPSFVHGYIILKPFEGVHIIFRK